jgi:YidC/Oxa1 family membrane protein insertase
LLDPVYFVVSGVMWCWHQLFGFLLGPASGATWALSVVFLVLTLRALLIRPFLAQMRSARAMRELAPQLTALRARHADDPARQLQETRALQKAHGVSAAGTLVPALLQVPVFVGLLHVLTHFDRRGLTFEQNAAIANYAFGPDEVRSFLEARLFGVPLSAYLSMPDLNVFGGHIERWEVAVVAVPLTLLAALATHLTARLSLRQQPVDGPLAGIMRWTPWIFPLGVLIGGAFFPFPVAILLYWLTNSAWTLGQQWLVGRPLQSKRGKQSHLPATTLRDSGLTAIRTREPAGASAKPRPRRRHSSGHCASRRRR